MHKLALNHEGKVFNIVQRDYDEYHGVTAAVITMNEEENIVEFLEHIRPLVDRIVIVDGGSTDKTIELAEPLVDALKVIPFTGHFGKQKNNAIEMCYTDWVLFLDPDERLDTNAYNKIKELIEQDDIDCYAFPRREFRDGVEDESVYPDYQRRLFRAYCRYVRPVHEELVGYKEEKQLEQKQGLDIMHRKPNIRHATRNGSYPYFEVHYMHECGKPGEQLKDTSRKILMKEETDG